MCNSRVLTLDEVASTQDAAIEHDLQGGDVCRSFNQTAGRGRRGNEWNSSGGVAVTVVLDSVPPHFPIAVAATIAAGINNLIPHHRVGIKWPNDLYVDGKKVAGVLIEHREGRYLVGVGVNILEAPIPNSTALKQLGFEGTWESVADIVTGSVFDAAQIDVNKAVTSWADRDILVGTTQTVQSGNNIVEGVVLHINPSHSLILQTPSGILECAAATATIVNPCQ